MTSVSSVGKQSSYYCYHRLYLLLFLNVFLNCYSAIRLLSPKCKIKLSSV